MRAALQYGFTLIELLIALVIVALLTMLAAPMYGEMIANTEVRNAAESVLSGLRTAQGEAIHLNAPAKFVLDADGWQVQVTNLETLDFDTTACSDTYAVATCARTHKFSEGAKRAKVTPTGGSEVTFNGLGQIINQATAISQVDVTTTAISSPRNLRILVGTKDVAAGMKLCDPSYASSDPVGCPSPST